jgi:hypothetical protein
MSYEGFRVKKFTNGELVMVVFWDNVDVYLVCVGNVNMSFYLWWINAATQRFY